MKTLIIGSVLLLLSGCSGIPSFWDDNESMIAVDVRYAADRVNCDGDYVPDVLELKNRVDYFVLYTESRGSDDINEMVVLMKETVDGFYENEKPNAFYCKLKKKIVVQQSSDIADAVMGRY